jgi:hypothetical protein
MRNIAPINHFPPTLFSPNLSPIYREMHFCSQRARSPKPNVGSKVRRAGARQGCSEAQGATKSIKAEGSNSHVQPQGATFCAQQGAHEIISPERAPAGLPEWLLEFEPTLMTPFASSVLCGSARSFLREPIEHVGGWLREGRHVPGPQLYGARS